MKVTNTLPPTHAPRPERTVTASGRLASSVVICTRSTERFSDVQAALHALDRQSVRPDEVLVVVDYNEDLFAMIANHAERNSSLPMLVIMNRRQPGVAGARNTGLAASNGEVVVFLDDDAAPHTNWLDALLRCYDDEQTMGVSGRATASWHIDKPEWFAEEYGWVVGCSPKGMPQSRSETQTLTGCNMSFRRSALTRSNGFQDDIGEVDLCHRLRARNPGMKLIHEPQAEVRHRVWRERSTFRYFQRRCYAEGVSKAHELRLCRLASGPPGARPPMRRSAPFSAVRTMFRGSRRLTEMAAILSGAAAISIGLGVGLLATRGSSDSHSLKNTRSRAGFEHLDLSLIEEIQRSRRQHIQEIEPTKSADNAGAEQ